MVQPFEVRVPEAELDQLRSRLRETRWAEDRGNADWRYGVERGWLEEMIRYWRDDYEWRDAERTINDLPQFRTEIDGYALHFVHLRSGIPDATPLLLLHGWPWTFMDFHAILQRLARPSAPGHGAFDLVVPSLPGFGFSPLPVRRRLGVPSVAGAMGKLMHDTLGYDRYGVAGGDFGAVLALELARSRADEVLGVFATTPVNLGVQGDEIDASAFSADEQWMVERGKEARRLVAGHHSVHVHDPQTLAYALVDSPVGTAAWIWARRRAWSDCDGDLTAVHDRDFLCTLASIYWLTGTIGTSLRMYRDNDVSASSTELLPPARRVEVPTGFAIHPKEVVLAPRSLAAAATDLRRWSVMPRGGHFAFAEQPDALAAELRAFFGEVRTS